MRSLQPSRPAGAEALEPAAVPTAPSVAAPADGQSRLHFSSFPSLLWTTALLLWWWAMQGSGLVAEMMGLIDAGAPQHRSLILVGLAAIGLVVVLLIHFVVVASAEVLRWLWNTAAHWLGLDT